MVASDFDASDFDLAGGAPALALAPASSCALTAVLPSFESLRGVLSGAVVVSRDRLSDAACESSARRGAGACDAAWELSWEFAWEFAWELAWEFAWARLSLSPALLSINAAKLSFPAAGLASGRADLADALCTDALSNSSDVSLTTGEPSR